MGNVMNEPRQYDPTAAATGVKAGRASLISPGHLKQHRALLVERSHATRAGQLWVHLRRDIQVEPDPLMQ